MKFHLTAEAIDALIEADKTPEDVLLAMNLMPGLPLELAIELVEDDVGRPKASNVIANMAEDCHEMLEPTKKKKRLPFKSRERLPRLPKEESHWHRRYLVEDKQTAIFNGETKEDASKVDRKLAVEF